jgi:hypothetical protein
MQLCTSGALVFSTWGHPAFSQVIQSPRYSKQAFEAGGGAVPASGRGGSGGGGWLGGVELGGASSPGGGVQQPLGAGADAGLMKPVGAELCEIQGEIVFGVPAAGYWAR